jgi:dTDP-4-dehydrorhamnose 3,5-epimerase
MKVVRTEIPEVVLIEPRVFEDKRGLFFESYNKRTFREATGVDAEFVQDNVSRSVKDVIRGLHYQVVKPQGKLIRCITGRIFDVAVDIRRSSPTFRRWVGFELSGSQVQQAWVPPGFAHGFLVLSDTAEVQYKVTEFWHPEHERTLLWNDPAIGMHWPLTGEAILAPRDAAGAVLEQAEIFS